MINLKKSHGFTLVELLITITIIGTLASIGVVSYGNYQKSMKESQLKSDLNGIATAMENARTFGDKYPTVLPDTFTPSQNVILSPVSTNTSKTTYCIDATNSDYNLHYYIDSSSGTRGAQLGTCAVNGPKTWTSQISASYNYTCAVASNSQVYCWGMGTSGELGNGLNVNSSVPVAVSTAIALNGKTVLSLSTGNNHSCVIASNNLAYCWGANWRGMLGNGSTNDSYIPTAVSSLGTVNSIDAGNFHTCVITSNNLAYCWGSNFDGELGVSTNVGTTNPNPVPIAVSNGLTMSQITAGEGHTCAITTSNVAYCWGRNNYGQLGDGSTTQRNVPTLVSTTGVLSGKTIKSIKAAKEQTCVIAYDIASGDQAYCWGGNWYGALGVATNNRTPNPNPVPVAVNTTGILNGKTIKSIATGVFHTCVIASDNQVYCWGANNYGQLGVSTNAGTDNSNPDPVAVDTTGALIGKTIVSISTSDGIHTCATDSDNKVYCWGSNVYGELGVSTNFGTNNPNPVPVLVRSP